MEFEDDGLEEGPVAPLLPPEDRLWRHPSEVAAHPLASLRRQASEPRMLTIVALTSAISVLLTLGVVAVVRPVRLAVEHVAPPAEPGTSGIRGVADVTAIADRLRPAVLHVIADGAGGTRTGSGVVYRSDGFLLTAHHVVDGAREVAVALSDGRMVRARVVGGDPETDIAVLDLDGDAFEVAPLGSATGLRVGQAAITIGTPEAGEGGPVVSVGVVSATGQEVAAGGRHLFDMIQTDGALSPGSAGGALVDASGVVIGIATMNVSKDGGANGYATPIDIARLVAGQLVTHGKVTRGWLGVEGDDLALARAKELALRGGVVVTAVRTGSPAHEVGLSTADVITELDGEPLASMVDLVVELRTRRPGDMVALVVVRGDERLTIKARLGERPHGS